VHALILGTHGQRPWKGPVIVLHWEFNS
jgi:hypothetical protein